MTNILAILVLPFEGRFCESLSRHPVLRAEMEQGHKRHGLCGFSSAISTICAIQQAFSTFTPFPFVDRAAPLARGAQAIACHPDWFRPMPETPVR
ncbi:hypothetical protein GE21DRAFT_1306255 [Neurospora crassa]|nr:hypothetical protein GE21DRAFT_1306255 [Neurospora crassa]